MNQGVIITQVNDSINKVARIMKEKQIFRLLAVDGKNTVGIVTLQDLTSNIENTHLKAKVLDQIKH